MKKLFTPVALLAFVLFSAGLLTAQQSQEEGKFLKTLETYFDEMWKFYPTSATLAGYYKYNDKLEDMSGKNIENRHDALDKLNQEFVAKIDKSKLSPDFQIDFEMMIDALDLELLRFENLVPWEYNPVFYNEILLYSIKSLLTKEFGPLDARVKSAIERAKQLPGLIKQAKENLKTPPQLYTETAIKQLPGIVNFYKTEVSGLFDQASPDLKIKFNAEMPKVISALEAFQSYLQSELLPKSTGNFRIGDQAHTRLLRLTAQANLSFDELLARAKADYSNIRREMFLVCIPFFKIMYPNVNLDQLGTQRSQDEVWSIAIKGVLDKIKGEHPKKEDFISQVKATADSIKSFISQNQLLELPPDNLNIETMPLALRGITYTILLAPGPYETAGNYACLLSPIPDDWSADTAQSFLEEYNNFYLNFWTVRRIFPGQFVPTYFTNKNASLVRKTYPNQGLLKGWPDYIEEMLIYSGFGNYDLRLRLNQLKLQLQAVIDFQLEFNIHQGGMTKEQAIPYMTRGGFQTQAEAEAKWNRIILKPCDSAYAYLGYQEILDMEKDYKKLKGDAFNAKEFLQKLLSYGALPLRNLKAKMVQ